MQQTATTQLYLKLQQIEFYYQQGDLTITEFIEAKKEASLQAEETFKQQIIDSMQVAFTDGIKTGQSIRTYDSPFQNWDQYIYETYEETSNN